MLEITRPINGSSSSILKGIKIWSELTKNVGVLATNLDPKFLLPPTNVFLKGFSTHANFPI